MKNDSEYLWTTEKDKYVLVKSDNNYSIIEMINNSFMIIEDDDEFEYIVNMMLKSGNKVFDWETYTQIKDGRTIPILVSKVGNLITYKWPDTGEIFTFLAGEPLQRVIRYKLAIIWSDNIPTSKQINKLRYICPELCSMNISEFLIKIKQSTQWIFATGYTLEVAQEVCLNAQKERVNIVMIPEKVWPEDIDK